MLWSKYFSVRNIHEQHSFALFLSQGATGDRAGTPELNRSPLDSRRGQSAPATVQDGCLYSLSNIAVALLTRKLHVF